MTMKYAVKFRKELTMGSSGKEVDSSTEVLHRYH